MTETVTIKKIYRDQKQTKFGPKVMTSIYTQEHPDVRMSSFDKGLDNWKEGDKVVVTISKNGNFTNFTIKDTKTNLEARVEKLERAVFGSKEETKQPDVQLDEPEAVGEDW
jgi:hypothetical protein